MINVNQITAQLARMPDQALQQYAAMHKGDPYTVSLALSESNRRKQMRAAAQMPQGEQPKVVDQGIAEMAMPEDVGIGALPAGNMNFADGGIVGYAGGGEVDAARARRNAAQQALYTYGLRQRRDDPQGFAAAQAEFSAAQQEAAAAEAAYAAEMSGTGVTRAAMGAQDVGATRQFSMPATPSPTDPSFRRAVTPGALPSMPSIADQMKAQNAPVADTGGAGVKGSGIKQLLAPSAIDAPRAAGAAPATNKTYMDFLGDAEKAVAPAVDPTAEKRKENLDAATKREEEAIAKRKVEIAEEDATMFKGKEERIGKKEAALGKETGRVEGMALLEAGLAIMQSKGRGLAGIAQGAGVGLKAYTAGIDKIKSAQEKLEEARDRIEDLRLNKASMNKSEIRTAEKGIRDLQNRSDEQGLAGLAQAIGEDKKDVRSAATAALASQEADKTRAFQAQQEALNRSARAEIAKMPSAQVQMIEKLGGGNFAKGYEIYKQEASIPRLYESYLKSAEDLQKPEFKAKYPTFDTYLAGMGGGKSAGIIDIPDGAAAAVRPRN